MPTRIRLCNRAHSMPLRGRCCVCLSACACVCPCTAHALSKQESTANNRLTRMHSWAGPALRLRDNNSQRRIPQRSAGVRPERICMRMHLYSTCLLRAYWESPSNSNNNRHSTVERNNKNGLQSLTQTGRLLVHVSAHIHNSHLFLSSSSFSTHGRSSLSLSLPLTCSKLAACVAAAVFRARLAIGRQRPFDSRETCPIAFTLAL